MKYKVPRERANLALVLGFAASVWFFLPRPATKVHLVHRSGPTAAEPGPFGFCHSGASFAMRHSSACTPCLATSQKVGAMALDDDFRSPYWGQVDFTPVPPFWINTHDPLRQDLFISGSVHAARAPWDPFIWDLVVRLSAAEPASDKGLVVDVGANIGYFSLLAAALGHPVVAFEPMNRNVAKFFSSIHRNGLADRITLYQNAVAPRSGARVILHSTHPTNQGNGKISAKGPSPFEMQGSYGEHYVETVALSDVVHSDVFLLKIAVEGFESAVLDGARKLLCQHVVRFVVIEFSPDTRVNPACSAVNMLQTMHALGYVASDVVPQAPPLQPDQMSSFPPNILFHLQYWATAPVVRLRSAAPCDF